jgi:hypothetical protein
MSGCVPGDSPIPALVRILHPMIKSSYQNHGTSLAA